MMQTRSKHWTSKWLVYCRLVRNAYGLLWRHWVAGIADNAHGIIHMHIQSHTTTTRTTNELSILVASNKRCHDCYCCCISIKRCNSSYRSTSLGIWQSNASSVLQLLACCDAISMPIVGAGSSTELGLIEDCYRYKQPHG
jgi:hypothetical protein